MIHPQGHRARHKCKNLQNDLPPHLEQDTFLSNAASPKVSYNPLNLLSVCLLDLIYLPNIHDFQFLFVVGFAIDWQTEFLGKEALLEQKAKGLRKRLVAFVL